MIIINILKVFQKASLDTWIQFMGTIISSIITALSIYVAAKGLKQQNREKMQPYYDKLLESLPSYDTLKTQADYLDDKDNLLGGAASAEDKIYILEERLKKATGNDKKILEYKIRKQKEYLDYWKKAKLNIDKLVKSSDYNVVKSMCNGEIILAYYNFITQFDNEHYYYGPVIDTEMLQDSFMKIKKAIDKQK